MKRPRYCGRCGNVQRGRMRPCNYGRCGGRAFYSGPSPRLQSVDLAVDSWRPEPPEPDLYKNLPAIPARRMYRSRTRPA